jgi:hypothetical protein
MTADGDEEEEDTECQPHLRSAICPNKKSSGVCPKFLWYLNQYPICDEYS